MKILNAKLPILLLLFFVFTSPALRANGVSVELPLQQLLLKYDTPVRLEQVLFDVKNNVDFSIYELGSQLFLVQDANETRTLLNKTLSELAQLAKSHPKSGAAEVHWQLRESIVKQRVFISLESDVVQTQTRQNPLLDGTYQLYVSPRPDTITILGLINNKKTLKFKAHTPLDSYLASVKYALMPNANSSVAYVIQPDGHVNDVPYDYWNYQPRYFAPGAIVFIGFDTLPKQYKHLNDAVIELLRNKANQ